MKICFEEQMQVISNAVRSLDAETFTQLATEYEAVLSDGRETILSGLGKNVPVCEKFAGTMNSPGLATAFMNTNTVIHSDIGMVQNGDLVIILIKSGDTSESVYLTSLFEQRDTDLWLLSFQCNSTLTERVPKHTIFNLEHEEDTWDITPNNSTTVSLIILRELTTTLSGRTGVTLADFKKNCPGGYIGRRLENA